MNDFSDVMSWWANRDENKNAWKINVAKLKDSNLDLRNPHNIAKVIDASPHEIIETIIAKENRMTLILDEIRDLINREIPK